MTTPDVLEKRAKNFARTRNYEIDSCLGAGTQGSVYLLRNPSRFDRVAVKFHEREVAYIRERDVYLRRDT